MCSKIFSDRHIAWDIVMSLRGPSYPQAIMVLMAYMSLITCCSQLYKGFTGVWYAYMTKKFAPACFV